MGTAVALQIGNALGAPTPGCILAGSSAATVNFPGIGGTFYVDPMTSTAVVTSVRLAAGVNTLPMTIPNSMSVCGASLFLQAVHADMGAMVSPQAFSPGLRVTIGQ